MARTIDEVFLELHTWRSFPAELERRGIKGRPECPERCPMAVYIISETNPDEVARIHVDGAVTTVWNKDGVQRDIDNPSGMYAFITDFDQGEWPDLSDDPGYFAFEEEEEFWSDLYEEEQEDADGEAQEVR